VSLPYDLAKTGRTAAVFLLLYCAAEVAFIWHSTRMVAFFDRLETGSLTQAQMDAEAANVDAVGAAVGGLLFLAFIASAIVSGMWIYRAASNAQAVTPDPERITPGWSVGWFFVPFANLVMPYRAVRQSWNGLHGNGDLNAGMPGWALLWWLCWLLGNSLSTAALRISLNGASLDDFRFATTVDILGSAASIAGAFLFRHLILELTRVSAQATPQVPSAPPALSPSEGAHS
jgi:hypothetical protein